MAEELRLWLRQQSALLCAITLSRAPNMLPDEDALIEYLSMLAQNVGASREKQLGGVQMWALTSIGHDARSAYDWLIILRVLKEEIGRGLEKRFTAQEALNAWRQIDDVLTYSIIEASQLASDIQRSDILEHMVQLREQKQHFEQSKTKFIAVAAHELKTPLTILEGYANILRAETQADSRLRIYIEGLGNGFRRMHEIIGDMIDVSLLDLKSVELKYQEVSLEKTVLQVADNLGRYYQERRVELDIVPFDVEQRTFADPELLKKVFTKVLLNALKYTPDGGRVTITAASIRQDEFSEEIGGFIDVQINDTGIGINPDDLEAIFEKFGSLADASLHSSGKTKFKGGGPGLGLPIARGIIEAHGGHIWAESPGCDEETCPGSTFHIEIPIWLKRPDVAADEGG